MTRLAGEYVTQNVNEDLPFLEFANKTGVYKGGEIPIGGDGLGIKKGKIAVGQAEGPGKEMENQGQTLGDILLRVEGDVSGACCAVCIMSTHEQEVRSCQESL